MVIVPGAWCDAHDFHFVCFVHHHTVQVQPDTMMSLPPLHAGMDVALHTSFSGRNFGRRQAGRGHCHGGR